MPNDHWLRLPFLALTIHFSILGTTGAFWSVLQMYGSSVPRPAYQLFSSPCIWQWLKLHIGPWTCYCCNNRMFKGQCAVLIEWGKLWNWQHNLNLECGLSGSSGGPWISCLALRWCPISSYLNRPHLIVASIHEAWLTLKVHHCHKVNTMSEPRIVSPPNLF